MGNEQSLRTVLDAGPHVLNHNLETVERLSDRVRSKAKYSRSLELLERSKRYKPNIPTKFEHHGRGGETWDEILKTMDDLRAVDCDIMTIGQYLQPTKKHLPVVRYYTPEEFKG